MPTIQTMTRTKRILPTFVCCLLFAGSVTAQSNDHSVAQSRDARLQRVETEFDLKMHELEFAMSERAVDEASIEVEKAELNLKHAQKQAASDRVEFAKLELKQAHIALDMQKLRSEMSRLTIQRAKTKLQIKKSGIIEKSEKRTPVHLEYDDDSDIVIIRGARDAVDRIKALIENAAKQK